MDTSTQKQQGKDAYCDCLELTDNPHPVASVEAKAWEDGWRRVYQNDPLRPDFEG